MAGPSGANPYPGPRPFERVDRAHFFGRDGEARTLLDLGIAERVVLFHAPSGAGKTSLLNAQVLPGLEAEGFLVLPVARVGRAVPPGNRNGTIFSASALADLQGESASTSETSLDGFLRPGEGEERPPRVLVLDQFEEILTTHPDHWRERETFFLELRRALFQDPALSLILAVREDKIAGLERYAPLLPGGLGCRVAMEPLAAAAAVAAVARPAEAAGRPFAPGVAESLVEKLSLVRSTVAEGTRPGPFVEPIQLQVVCRTLWASLAPVSDDARAPISEADLDRFGPVEGALERFYEEAVERVVTSGLATERRVRDWFGEELITPGPRALRQAVLEETTALPPPVVARLVDEHLIRKEETRGGVWLELVHDTFIDPVRAANARWLERQHRLLLDAQRWQEAGQPEGSFLYQGEQLAEAQKWMQDHPTAVSEIEQRFLALARSRQEAQAQREKNARTLRRFRNALAVALALVLALGGLGWYQTLEVERKGRVSASLFQAYKAREELPSHPVAALEKASDAVRTTLEPDRQVEPAVEEVFLNAFFAPRLLPLAPLLGETTALALDSRGRHLATLDFDGTVVLWRVVDDDTVMTRRSLANRGGGLALSPDGSLVASAGPEGGVELFPFAAGPAVLQLGTAGQPVVTLVFDPEGETLAALGEKGGVWAWELASGRPLVSRAAPLAAQPTTLALGRGGRLVLGDERGRVSVLDLVRGEVVKTFAAQLLPIFAIALDSEGRRLATVDNDGRTLLVFDLETAGPPVIRSSDKPSLALSFSADGRWLSTVSSEGQVSVWSVDPRADAFQRVTTLAADSTDTQLGLATWSGDGNFLAGIRAAPANASSQLSLSRLFRLELERAQQRQLEPLGGSESWAGTLAFVEGRRLAVATGKAEVLLLDEETLEPSSTLRTDGPVSLLASSFDGRFLATAGGDRRAVRVLNVRTGDVRSGSLPHSAPVTALAAGSWPGLATAAGKEVGLWNAETGARLDSLTVVAQVSAIAFSSDGRLLAVAGDQGCTLYGIPGFSDPKPCSPAGEPISGLAFVAGGRLVTAGSRGVFVWGLARGERLFKLPGFPLSASGLAHAANRLAIARHNGRLELLDLDLRRLLPRAKRGVRRWQQLLDAGGEQ